MLDLTYWAAWAGVVAIPITVVFGLVTLRGVKLANQQVSLAVQQNELAVVANQVDVLREQHQSEIQVLRARHEACEEVLGELKKEVARLQERHSLQREELMEAQTQRVNLMTQVEVLRLRLNEITRHG